MSRDGSVLAEGEEHRLARPRALRPGRLAGERLGRAEGARGEAALRGDEEHLVLAAQDGRAPERRLVGQPLQRGRERLARSKAGAGAGHPVDRQQLPVGPRQLVHPAQRLQRGAQLLAEEAESAGDGRVDAGTRRREGEPRRPVHRDEAEHRVRRDDRRQLGAVLAQDARDQAGQIVDQRSVGAPRIRQ